MKIGLTGGIASGKSTVSSMLVRKGAILIDADQIAREVVLPRSPALQEVAEAFGKDVLLPDGSLHRKALGDIVFRDEAKRKQLESILHPRIRGLMRERMEQAAAQKPDKLIVVDVPLLFESQLQHMFDQVLLVYVPRHMQRERLMARDRMTAEQAEHRLSAQMDIEEKRKLADMIIDNSGTQDETERQVSTLWDRKGWQ